MHLADADDGPDGTRACDDDVRGGHYGRQIVESDAAHGDSGMIGRDIACEVLRVGDGPVHHDKLADAFTGQLGGRKTPHGAGADDNGSAQRLIGIDLWRRLLQQMLGAMQRNRHDRRPRAVDSGLGVHPLADAQGVLGELVQGTACLLYTSDAADE